MSRSLTPKKDERSAATRAMRSAGSSIARSTASVSWTSWRSKKDLPPSTVKRSPAASSASSSAWIARQPPRQDQHVARRGSAARLPRHRVAHRLAAARDPGQEGGEAVGLRRRAGPRRARSAPAGKRSATTEGSSESPGGGAIASYGGLVRLVGLLDQLREHAVHEAQDGGPRAEVLRRGAARRRRPALRLAHQLAEQAHLGAPEAVDRLLGVAHHHERAGAVAGEEPRHLDLQRVGVLELVDHQEAEAPLEPRAHARVVAQRVARLQQQVEEVEDAALRLLALVDPHDAGERAHQAPVEVGPELGDPARARLLRPAGDRAALGERLGRRPVRLEAEVRRDRLERAAGARPASSPERKRDASANSASFTSRAAEAVALAHARRERRGARALRRAARAAPPRDRRRPRPRAAARSRWSISLRARPRSDVRSPQPSPSSGMPRSRAPVSTSSPPASRSPSHSSQVSTKSASAWASSAIRKPGSTRALERPLLQDLGAQRVDRRDARALEHVEGGAPRGRARPAAAPARERARSSRSRSRSFMVVAAFSVKVTAAISSSRAVPERTSDSMRSTSSVVLPVPAPASSTRLVAWSRRARSRASSSAGRKALIRCPAAAGTPAARGRGA